MKLHCPDCDKHVPAEHVNIKLGVGKCLACDAVFSLADQVGTPLPARRGSLAIAPPKRFRIDDFGPETTVSFTWYQPGAWFLLLFVIFWDGILVLWYAGAIGAIMNGKNMGAGAAFMLLLPSLHMLIGVGMTYGAVLMFLNRTTIKLAGGELSVSHGPLPSWGNCRLPTSEITQLFVTEQSHRRKRSHTYTYSVNALLTNGERTAVLTSLQDSFEALYLEQFLEEKLKLANQRVLGEYKG